MYQLSCNTWMDHTLKLLQFIYRLAYTQLYNLGNLFQSDQRIYEIRELLNIYYVQKVCFWYTELLAFPILSCHIVTMFYIQRLAEFPWPDLPSNFCRGFQILCEMFTTCFERRTDVSFTYSIRIHALVLVQTDTNAPKRDLNP